MRRPRCACIRVQISSCLYLTLALDTFPSQEFVYRQHERTLRSCYRVRRKRHRSRLYPFSLRITQTRLERGGERKAFGGVPSARTERRVHNVFTFSPLRHFHLSLRPSRNLCDDSCDVFCPIPRAALPMKMTLTIPPTQTSLFTCTLFTLTTE